MRKISIIVLIICLGIIIWGSWHFSDYGIERFEQEYKNHNIDRFKITQNRIENFFNSIYLSLRTTAMLDGVRQYTSPTKAFSKNERASIQKIFLNISAASGLSEIYIIPHNINFNPNQYYKKQPSGVIEFSNHYNEGDHHDEESTEDFEVKELTKHIEFFKRFYPKANSFNDLNYPATTGDEIITCDNRAFIPQDENRSDSSALGFIYSLPYYDHNGNFAGIVAGVIRTALIRELFKGPYYKLTRDNLELSQNEQSIIDNYFQYTSIVPIQDNRSWYLTMHVPAENFYSSAEVKELIFTKYLTIGAGIFISFLLLFLLYSQSNISKINKLNDELQQEVTRRKLSEERLKQFTSDASHELRSPIGLVRGKIEIALRKERSSDEYVKTLNESLSMIDHLQNILEGLLQLSRFDEKDIKLSYQPFYPATILNFAIDDTRKVYPQYHIKLDNRISESLIFFADIQKIRQVFTNLLSNSVKYSKNNHINLIATAIKEQDQIFIHIKDDGLGIPPEKLPFIFDRFYRVDKARTIGKEGSGLGLSICKKIMEAHQGDIKISSVLGEGTTVELRFPYHEMA